MIRNRFFVRGVLSFEVDGIPSSSSSSLSSRKTESLGFEGLRILGLGLEVEVSSWYSLSLVADSGGSEYSSSAGSSEVFFTGRIGTGSGGGGLRVCGVGLLLFCSRFCRSLSCSEEILLESFSLVGKYGRAS